MSRDINLEKERRKHIDAMVGARLTAYKKDKHTEDL